MAAVLFAVGRGDHTQGPLMWYSPRHAKAEACLPSSSTSESAVHVDWKYENSNFSLLLVSHNTRYVVPDTSLIIACSLEVCTKSVVWCVSGVGGGGEGEGVKEGRERRGEKGREGEKGGREERKGERRKEGREGEDKMGKEVGGGKADPFLVLSSTLMCTLQTVNKWNCLWCAN